MKYLKRIWYSLIIIPLATPAILYFLLTEAWNGEWDNTRWLPWMGDYK